MQSLEQRQAILIQNIKSAEDISELLPMVQAINIDTVKEFLLQQYDTKNIDQQLNSCINSAYLSS